MNPNDNQYLTDDILLTWWKNGDVKAYETLFFRYYESLFKYVNCSIKNNMLAEELVMDVMMRVWKNGTQITTPPGFKAYLLRSIKNAVANHYRTTLPLIVSIDALPENESWSSVADFADERLGHHEVEEKYSLALSSLSEKKREVFLLSREKKLTYKEIAHRLDISVNTVENYMSASIAELRKKFNRHK